MKSGQIRTMMLQAKVKSDPYLNSLINGALEESSQSVRSPAIAKEADELTQRNSGVVTTAESLF